MASEFKAYQGQVVFYTTFQTLESMIVSEAIDAAVPEHEDFKPGSQLLTIYRNFRFYLASTERIEFHLRKDADDDLKTLQGFWKVAANNTDYAALWPRFRKLTLDIHDCWNDAIMSSIPARLLAPADLQPGAPEDDDLAVLDPNVSTPEPVT